MWVDAPGSPGKLVSPMRRSRQALGGAERGSPTRGAGRLALVR